MGEGFPALFLSSAAVAVEERFWGFNLCIPFYKGGGSGVPPPPPPRKILENLECR